MTLSKKVYAQHGFYQVIPSLGAVYQVHLMLILDLMRDPVSSLLFRKQICDYYASR